MHLQLIPHNEPDNENTSRPRHQMMSTTQKLPDISDQKDSRMTKKSNRTILPINLTTINCTFSTIQKELLVNFGMNETIYL